MRALLRHPFVIALLPLLLPGCGASPPPEPPAPVAPAPVVIPAAKPTPAAEETEERESSQTPSTQRRFKHRIEDPSAPENAAIIEFCETYRLAVQEMDVDRLVSMASPGYYDDGGTDDSIDDVDRDRLEAYLRMSFVNSKVIRYEMTYHRIVREKDVIHVDYSYTASFQSAGQSAPKALSEENRLELVPTGDSFLIRSGM